LIIKEDSMEKSYDAIVVGSGPGGATVARGMVQKGKSVLLLEKGNNRPCTGTYLNALKLFDRFGFYKSKEGLAMLKATTVGGATMVYSGSAAMPPPWLKTDYNIDLMPYAEETIRELKVEPLPAHLLGEASAMVMAAGNRLGQEWEPMPKFLDPGKFINGKSSGARTSLGFNLGERWTARDYIDQAVDAGATLMTRAECVEIVVNNNRAVGVKVRSNGKKNRLTTFYGNDIVLAAGGIPSPVLLKRAGIDRAGQGCVVDPTILVYGIHPDKGSFQDPLVSVVSWKWYDRDGIRVGTLIDPWLMTLISLAKAGFSHLFKILNYRRMIGILVKVKDELGGYVDKDGVVSKELTPGDLEKLRKGEAIAREVLVEAGCDPGSIVPGEIRGAHPSGTCRIGHVVDDNLETRIKNLYVCDASVFPEALDRPTVITIIAFGKRLVEHLLKQ
jgi:choline dehydrogenase-like flavoprotein